MSTKKLIVGLGNPGKKYEKTRHNIGFEAVELYINKSGLAKLNDSKGLHSLISDNPGLIVIEPTNFMNNSGQAVKLVTDYYKITDLNSIIIVHDDLDLAAGQIKIQKEKSDAGHKGVRSIIDHLGNDIFWRLRIGIAGETKGKAPGDQYVLSPFTKDEQVLINVPKLVDALTAIIEQGPQEAAQKFNQTLSNETN